jgi:beta-aspartyl-dipeptidase (metallo-type)
MFTLIEHGEVYTPAVAGVQSILLAGKQIAKIGPVDAKKLAALDVACETIDATDCVVIPGLIDPHAHLIGAGGENGFASRMPEITFSQLVEAGVTTVVGLLGTDTTTRYLSCLHAKASQLRDEGLTTYLYTGGFELPPKTFVGSVMDDIVMIEQVIGVGEIAISDYRWVDPPLRDLAVLVKEAMLGGMIGGKAGVTHFHVGDSAGKLTPLHTLLNNYDVPPHCLYATHVSRNEALLDDAIALAKRGAFVDMDTIEENLGQCLTYYREHGGPADRLTVSSDTYTPGGSPRKLYGQLVACATEYDLPLPELLPHFTSNVACALKLLNKGRLDVGKDGDLLILDKDSLDIAYVIAGGQLLLREGELVRKSKQEEQVEQSR